MAAAKRHAQAAEGYAPVLMGQARLLWEREAYGAAERLLRAAAPLLLLLDDGSSESAPQHQQRGQQRPARPAPVASPSPPPPYEEVWRLNLAHTVFMQVRAKRAAA